MSVFKAWSNTLLQSLELLELASSSGPAGQWFRELILAHYEDVLDGTAVEGAIENASGVWRSGRELLKLWSSEEQELNLVGLIQLLNDIEDLLEAGAELDEYLDPSKPGQLLGGLIANTLVGQHPLVGFVATLLGLIEIETYDAPAIISTDSSTGLFPLGSGASFNLDALASLLRDPKDHLIQVANRAHRRVDALTTMERLLAPVLAESFSQMGWTLSTSPPIQVPASPSFENVDVGKWSYELVSINLDTIGPINLNVGLCRQFASYGIIFQIDLNESFNINLDKFYLSLDLNNIPSIIALGSFGLLFDDTDQDFSGFITVTPSSTAYSNPLSFGIDKVFQLVFQSPALRVGVDGPDINALHAEISSRLALTLGSAESDSFLSSLLSSFSDKPVEADIALAWSPKQGVHLKGSGDLSLSLPLKLPEASPVQISGAEISLTLPQNDEPLAVHTAASLSAKLGPLSLVVERTGLTVSFDASTEGAVGAKLDVDFLPPRGVGMSIKTAVVSGGGYLYFDWAKAEYGGAVALDVGSLSLRALGIITTRLPGGQKGFSMIVVITADFKPIQLGLGFTLNGVGGLFGVNRTIEVDVLRQGLKEGVLDAVLLSEGGKPEEFIERAPELLGLLAEAFPVSKGQYLFGPIITLGWGTPTLISARLGVMVELPNPLRMVLVGTVLVQLPAPEAPVVDLRMDVLGVLEPTERRVSMDATLFDSRIGLYSVSGDMAFRMSWGDQPSFLLSIGGFHPSYEAPPALQSMRRMAISVGKGDNPRLALEAYLALTSNTVQMGARLELYASELGFAISGSLGFDTLLYLEPFSLQVDLFAKVALIREKSSTKLMTVNVEASLTGPGPWRVSGLAGFTFLGIDREIPFSKTFGTHVESEPPTVEIWPLLATALVEPKNWASQLPAASSHTPYATLEVRDREDASVLVHPSSALELRQQVLPLGLMLERFGVAIPEQDERYFEVTDVKIGGESVPYKELTSHFAPGEYLELTEQEKLSRPSFEPLSSGLAVQGFEHIVLGNSKSINLDYEQRVIDEPYASPTSDRDATLAWDTMVTFTPSSDLSGYDEPGLGVALRDGLYIIVDQRTLIESPQFAGIEDTYVKQSQRIQQLPEAQRRLLRVVPVFEAAA